MVIHQLTFRHWAANTMLSTELALHPAPPPCIHNCGGTSQTKQPLDMENKSGSSQTSGVFCCRLNEKNNALANRRATETALICSRSRWVYLQPTTHLPPEPKYLSGLHSSSDTLACVTFQAI